MHITALTVENFKRLRAVTITPKGRLVQITGKNGQGKTSVIDAIWTALVGKRATQDKPVRKGAETARIKLQMGDIKVMRTINAKTGNQQLTVEKGAGVKIDSPQTFLDELLGELAFDPMEFVRLKPLQQVEMLRGAVKLDVDVDELNRLNQIDYETRREINRTVDRLAAELAAIVVAPDTPAEPINVSAIQKRIESANELNQEAAAQNKRKADLHRAALTAESMKENAQYVVRRTESKIAELEEALANARTDLQSQKRLAEQHAQEASQASSAWESVPECTMVNLQELSNMFIEAQRVNQAVEMLNKRNELEKRLRQEQENAQRLTRTIEDRNEQKTEAMANAEMPVKGLTFDDAGIQVSGIPLEQLGEAEQIRIGVKVAMAVNPELRVLRILHGEALDEDSLAIIAEMAEQHDYQVWTTKVDSSGKIGIVIEDGMVKAENGEAL